MTDAQQWLNNNYPLNQRENVRKLLICNDTYRENEVFQNEIVPQFDVANTHYLTTAESLTGTLEISSFPRLKRLMVKKQLIGKLIFTDCRKLEEIYAEDNLLREIVLPQNNEKLDTVSLVNNNFFAQNLFCFSRFTNLNFLRLGTNNSRRIRNNIYNRWNGSLIHLENLNELKELDINATDIDSGLEYLPVGELYYFTCGDIGRTNARVNNIKQTCNFDEEEATNSDIEDNLFKVGEIIQLQRRWENQIEVQTNRQVHFRS